MQLMMNVSAAAGMLQNRDMKWARRSEGKGRGGKRSGGTTKEEGGGDSRCAYSSWSHEMLVQGVG